MKVLSLKNIFDVKYDLMVYGYGIRRLSDEV